MDILFGRQIAWLSLIVSVGKVSTLVFRAVQHHKTVTH